MWSFIEIIKIIQDAKVKVSYLSIISFKCWTYMSLENQTSLTYVLIHFFAIELLNLKYSTSQVLHA